MWPGLLLVAAELSLPQGCRLCVVGLESGSHPSISLGTVLVPTWIWPHLLADPFTSAAGDSSVLVLKGPDSSTSHGQLGDSEHACDPTLAPLED